MSSESYVYSPNSYLKNSPVPAIFEIPLTLDKQEVLRRLGLGNRSNIRPRITSLILEMLEAAEKDLLKPAIAYEYYPVSEIKKDCLILGGGVVFHGPFLAKNLASAAGVALAVCTIGPILEEKVSGYFTEKDPLRATLLDGIGSAAVDTLSQKTCRILRQEADYRGFKASSPFSPGMHGFPLAEQSDLCRSVRAEQIGVSLTTAAMMVPRKSVSMLMGLGKNMPIWTQAHACGICELKRTCHDRVH